MASSVARMPTDDWRDPNRLVAGVFGAHARHPLGKSLRKVLVRELDRDHAAIAASPSSSSTPGAVGARDAVSPRKNDEPSSAVGEDADSQATARRRQSQVLDRWAARQAREMVTTIERQAHEDEISALTATAQPVSARAASFLRDSSPSFSDTSAATVPVSNSVSAGAGAGGCGAATSSARRSIDLPPNVRASSLIQMWRELEAEAEAGITPASRTTTGGSNSAFTVATATMTEEQSGDVCDDSEAFGDSDSDVTMTPPHASMSENERGRVESIVKMLSSANATRSSTATSGSDEVETLSRASSGASDHGESQSLRCTSACLRRVRGRRETEDLLAKLEQERRSELAAMAELQHVSRFLYRGRLQVSRSTNKNDFFIRF